MSQKAWSTRLRPSVLRQSHLLMRQSTDQYLECLWSNKAQSYGGLGATTPLNLVDDEPDTLLEKNSDKVSITCSCSEPGVHHGLCFLRFHDHEVARIDVLGTFSKPMLCTI